ncbi:MAG: hypothetical protein JWL72_3077 [Ilumatobacteraceae bacterium]|nr:hypothetical protein [Ilumatobacteraceae bacterium]
MSLPSLPWQVGPGESADLAVSVNYTVGDLYQYAAGYRDGADAIYASMIALEAPPDLLVYPLAYCLRHATELALKLVTRGGNSLNDGAERFSDGHHLGRLWDECHLVLTQIWPSDSDTYHQIKTTIDSWIAIDPDGEAFRYPVSVERKKTGRTATIPSTLRHIDVRAMYGDVMRTLDLLFGADTGIDVQMDARAEAHADAQYYADEMRAENAEQYDDY